MHILPPIHRERTIFLALLALVVLGGSLSFLTWQNLRQQKIVVEQHMVLAAKAIAAGVENNMGWSMRHSRGVRSGRDAATTFFQELLASPDVLFVGVYGPFGQLLTSLDTMAGFPDIPAHAFLNLREKGQWHAFVPFQEKQVLLFARKIRPMVARHFLDGTMPARPDHHLPVDKRPFLILGLDMDEHLLMYQDARRAALVQTGYILGASAALWLALITLLKRREQSGRVKELEQFQSLLLDNLPDGLLTLDCDGVIRSANPAAMNILKHDRELTGKRWNDLSLQKAGESPTGMESWNQYSCGDRFLEIFTAPLRESCTLDNQTLILVRDRTRIRTLESSLQEAQRLAAIGRLAAAVAHEIRNPLSALRGFAQYFATKLTGQEPEQTYARTMVSEADRLDRVITDLLFLSRPRTPVHAKIELDAFLEELRTLVQPDLDSRQARLVVDFTVSSLWADLDLLKQVFLNLIMNALEAMPDHGGTIRVFSTADSAPKLHQDELQTGVWVSVEDNGRGMDAKQRENALEPFYTTRADGAGLGLSIVHRIIQDHGGRMEILSTPSMGTTIRLFFPNLHP